LQQLLGVEGSRRRRVDAVRRLRVRIEDTRIEGTLAPFLVQKRATTDDK